MWCINLLLSYFFLLLHITAIFRSTNGTVFTKADIDAACCKAFSVSSSITGDQLGWPLYNDGRCGGGWSGYTLQGWIDYGAKRSEEGLCIDGFLYTVKGIVFRLNHI